MPADATPSHAHASCVTRRGFIKTTAVVATGLSAGLMATGDFAYAAGSDAIRLGLVGCGGRGKGAVRDAVRAAPGVEFVAMGDLFEDQIRQAQQDLKGVIGDAYRVAEGRVYLGWDAYRQVIEDDRVNYVLLCAPGVFRPLHLTAAVEAGKHVFAEKPISVDPVGCRAVMALGDRAKEKGVGILAGTQRRHTRAYLEALQRVHDGQIGELVAGQIYFNVQGISYREREPGWTDMEYMVRNFRHYTHLSGDCPLELLLHNIDVANWAMQAHPVRIVATGGRQTRAWPQYGNIYDHFGIDFEYPNGARVFGMTRRQEGTSERMAERFVGTRGEVNLSENMASNIRGERPWRFDAEQLPGIVQEHQDFIASIRAGTPLNEARRVAESNLTAIMAREAAYTGRELTWDEVALSNQDLTLHEWAFGPMPDPPVATPGRTPIERNWLGEPLAAAGTR